MYNNPLTTIKQTQGVANVNKHFERSKVYRQIAIRLLKEVRNVTPITK